MENLGKKAKDKITGFKGVIIAKIYYLTGCDQYGITPPAKNNETEDTQYFDVLRVIVAKSRTAERTSTETGGPNRDAPK